MSAHDDGLRVGLFAPFVNPFATREYLAAFARAADERGFHSLWASEHVVLFDAYASRYPYAADGRIPGAATNGLLEPFSTLSFVAAHTSRIRLGTGICLVPQRNPVYTAKEVTNVDWLSGGRFDFGVGVGWLSEEFEALGVPFERRGARCREYLRLMRALWTEEVVSFEGEFHRLADVRQDPKPIQRPHPPIHFGGESDAALRRVADLGQGWHGLGLEPEAARERVQTLTSLLDERGRSRGEVEVTVSPYLRPIDRDDLARYRDAGADQVTVLAVAVTIDDIAPTLDHLAESLVVPAASL